jgi:hypothetical protein
MLTAADVVADAAMCALETLQPVPTIIHHAVHRAGAPVVDRPSLLSYLQL